MFFSPTQIHIIVAFVCFTVGLAILGFYHHRYLVLLWQTQKILHPFDLNEDLLDLSINDSLSPSFNEFTLIGQVVSDKIVNFRTIKAILSNVWDFGSQITITSIDRNKFSCTFEILENINRVLTACPWSIKGHIILRQKLSPELSMNELSFRFSPFWIQIHNIPLNRMNRENAEQFGNFIGTFLQVDKGTMEKKLRGYLRIQVKLDVTQSLKTDIFIKNEDESFRWLAFKYERLSDFCFNCGKLGHVSTSCSSSKVQTDGVLHPKYAFGPWLKLKGNTPLHFQETPRPVMVSDSALSQAVQFPMAKTDGTSHCTKLIPVNPRRPYTPLLSRDPPNPPH